MTLSRVDLHTPAELSEQYVDAIDVELQEIAEEIERHRQAWLVLEDRRDALRTIRTRHMAAREALNAPTTLHDLIADDGLPPA